MKKFLLGFAEGYFIVSVIIYIAQKAWLEFTVCCSSMVYIIIRIVADVNKINLPAWFENFDIPTISLFLMAFILLYRSEEKYDKG